MQEEDEKKETSFPTTFSILNRALRFSGRLGVLDLEEEDDLVFFKWKGDFAIRVGFTLERNIGEFVLSQSPKHPDSGRLDAYAYVITEKSIKWRGHPSLRTSRVIWRTSN